MNEWKRLFAAAVLLTIAGTGPLGAWGQDGHRITAELAERHLSAPAAAAVDAILGGESLARAATWPDEIRSYPSWNCAQQFHFATLPPGQDYPDQGLRQGDTVQALVYFIDLLRSPDSDARDRRIALAFVVHLVGDVHQPLHNGRGCDRGGNSLKVTWFQDEDVTFHAVWDSRLIEEENLSFTEWADFLDHADADQVAEIQAATPVDWVFESQQYLDGAYTCFTEADRCPCFCGSCADGRSRFGGCMPVDGECELMAAGPVKMSWSYKTVNLPVVRDRLLRGGLRLAGLLNWALDTSASPPDAYAAMARQVRALPNYDTGCLDACRGTEDVSVPPPDRDPACWTR